VDAGEDIDCRDAALMNMQVGSFFILVFFLIPAQDKANIISRATIFGRIGVGLWTKDMNPTPHTPNSTSKSLEIIGLNDLEITMEVPPFSKSARSPPK
jgi:hypothetical protein